MAARSGPLIPSVFSARILKVAYLPFAPVVVPYVDEGGQLRVQGMAGGMFDAIVRACNISYELQLSSDGRYGMQLPNGSLTGALRDIEDQTADMTVNLYFSNEPALIERLRITQTSVWGKVCLLSAMRTAYVSTPVPFTEAFDCWSWYAILASSALVMLFLIFEPWLRRGAPCNLRNIFRSLSIVFQTLLQETTNEPFTGDFSKFIGGLWILATFILSESYRCNGKANLVVQSPTLRITTLEDLFRKTDVKLYFPDNTPTHNYMLTFPGKDGENYRSFENSFGSSRKVEDLYGDDLVDEALERRAVLLTDTVSASFMIPKFCKERKNSYFYIGWEDQVSFMPAAWVAGHHLGKDFNDMIDQKLLWLIAYGVPFPRQISPDVANSGCLVGRNLQPADTAEALGYQGVAFGFELLAASLVFCLCSFFLELLCSYGQRRRLRKRGI